jgi:hypothetical protein
LLSYMMRRKEKYPWYEGGASSTPTRLIDRFTNHARYYSYSIWACFIQQ